MRSTKGRKVVMALALAFIAGTAAATQAGFERMTYRDYRFMLRDAHLAYEKGQFDRAFELYKRNACTGEKSSQFALGTMYLNGEGTQADGMKAYAWLKSAAEARELQYRQAFESVKKAVPKEHITTADQYANDVIARYGMKATNVACQMRAATGTNIERLDCSPPVDSRTGYVEIKTCD